MTGRNLKSADEVIDALGGTVATADLTGRKAQHVSNWRASGRLPANTFLVISKELSGRGKNAPPSIWGITEPEKVN